MITKKKIIIPLLKYLSNAFCMNRFKKDDIVRQRGTIDEVFIVENILDDRLFDLKVAPENKNYPKNKIYRVIESKYYEFVEEPKREYNHPLTKIFV